MTTVKDRILLTQYLCMWHDDLAQNLNYGKSFGKKSVSFTDILHNNYCHAVNKLILVKSRHLGIYKTFLDQILFLNGAVL
jgi:hypothetical protein